MQIVLQVILTFNDDLLANDEIRHKQLVDGSAKALRGLVDESDERTDSFFHDEGLPGPDDCVIDSAFPSYTIATGDLENGFELYGIFGTNEDACEHANTDGNLPDACTILQIHPVADDDDEYGPEDSVPNAELQAS